VGLSSLSLSIHPWAPSLQKGQRGSLWLHPGDSYIHQSERIQAQCEMEARQLSQLPMMGVITVSWVRTCPIPTLIFFYYIVQGLLLFFLSLLFSSSSYIIVLSSFFEKRNALTLHSYLNLNHDILAHSFLFCAHLREGVLESVAWLGPLLSPFPFVGTGDKG
jgi:hypothetical protein